MLRVPGTLNSHEMTRAWHSLDPWVKGRMDNSVQRATGNNGSLDNCLLTTSMWTPQDQTPLLCSMLSFQHIVGMQKVFD